VSVICSLTAAAGGQTTYYYPAFPMLMGNADGVVVVGGDGAGVISRTEYFEWYGGFYQRVYPGARLPENRSTTPSPPTGQVATRTLTPVEEIIEPAVVVPYPEVTVANEVATVSPPPAQVGEAVPGGNGWVFKLAPYLWLPAVDVNVGPGVAPPDPTATASADTGIFGLDFGLLLMGEARRGQFGVVSDFAYVAASPNGLSPGESFLDVDLKVRAAVGTLGAFYSLPDWRGIIVDAIIGLRYWALWIDLDFSAGALDPVSVDLDKYWVDPIFGARLGADLGGEFYVTAYADVGGFGLGSNITWQVYGGVGYRFEDWISAEIGYRYLFIDRDIGIIPFELGLHAPLVAVNFTF
jgi:hypothetical protein